MDPECVPAAQKRIIREANVCGVPVITATQMLDSMIGSPRPTRAEASDVANAILDGTDAVMLSGETAIGKYPVEAAQMMGRIAEQIEGFLFSSPSAAPAPARQGDNLKERALAAAACTTARDINAQGIAAFTITGTTARWMSQRRPCVPIFALTPNERTYRRMALLWGVCPVKLPVFENTDQMIEQGEQRLLELGAAAIGDVVICVAGASTRTPGGTDMLKIHRLDGKGPAMQ